MCEWGTTEILKLKIPASLSYTGKEYIKPVAIDKCIVSLVKALNNAGIVTVASCCGHGRVPGNIALADGRELIISPNYEITRKIEKMFPKLGG